MAALAVVGTSAAVVLNPPPEANPWDRWNIVATMEGHAGDAESAAISPDGLVLATTGSDEFLRLWSMTDGRKLHEITADMNLSPRSFSPDSRTLAVGARDAQNPSNSRIVLLDVMTGGSRDLVRGLAGSLHRRGLAFSPDGALIAASTGDGVNLYATGAADGAPLRRFQGPVQEMSAVAFSPDGHLLAGAPDASSLKPTRAVVSIWKVADGAPVSTVTGDEISARIEHLALLPDGQALAYVTGGSLFLWRKGDATPARLDSGYRGIGLGFSADGTTLMSALLGGDSRMGQEVRIQTWRVSDARAVDAGIRLTLAFGDTKNLPLLVIPDGQTLVTPANGKVFIRRLTGR